MVRILIISAEERGRALSSGLAEEGLACEIVPDMEMAMEKLGERAPDLVLLGAPASLSAASLANLAEQVKRRFDLPVIALVGREILNSLDFDAPIDDFVVESWNAAETAFRIKRVLRKTSQLNEGEVIGSGDLVIDIAKCEVSIKGRLVPLNFKEYELLRLLAGHEGRVFSRQSLLNRIWGEHYYGGDRTLDVHIRRLRSKIEDRQHCFIETVRNIGYKFKPRTRPATLTSQEDLRDPLDLPGSTPHLQSLADTSTSVTRS